MLSLYAESPIFVKLNFHVGGFTKMICNIISPVMLIFYQYLLADFFSTYRTSLVKATALPRMRTSFMSSPQ